MRLTARFGGIALLLFLALFFDFNNFEFKWSMLTGICEEVYVDGILNTLEKNKVILKPVGLRDPKASFEPFKK